MREVRIRRARPGDGVGLARIWTENARQYLDLAPADFQLPQQQGLAEFLDPVPGGGSEMQVDLVAEVNGELAGFATATMREPMADADKQYVPQVGQPRIQIEALGVGAAHQRHGVATRLVEELEQWGRERGATLVAAETYVNSPLSVPFWQRRMGYRPRSVVMWKRLTGDR